MKKILSIAISAVLLLSLYSGCSSNQGETGDSKSTTGVTDKTQAGAGEVSSGGKKTTIKWLFWYPEPTELIKNFNESQNEINLEYENIAGTNYPTALNTRIAAGEAPDIYAIYFRETYEQQAKENGLVDLTDKGFMKNFDPVAIAQNTAEDGKIYGMPTTASINGMFYNKEILKKYNISEPKNWQEYLAASETLKKNGVVPQVQGMKDGWQVKFAGLNPVAAMEYRDEKWVDKLNAGEAKWTDPEVLEEYKKKEDFMNKGYIHENSLSMTFQQAWQVFCEGKAAFIAGGSYYINNVFPQLRPEFDWGVMPIPLNDEGEPLKVEYFTDNTTIVVNSKGKNVEKALKFVEWFAQPDNMNAWAKTGLTFVPLKDPNFTFDPAAERFKDLFTYDKFKFTREPQYITAEFAKTQQEMMLKLKSAEDVVKELQDKTDVSIKK